MKIAFFGDVHCAIRKEFDEHSDITGSKRLDLIIKALDDIRTYCVDNHVQVAVCTGDLFHVRSKIDVMVFNAVYDCISRFSQGDIKVVLLAGNHDLINNSDSPQSSLRTFSNIENVYVVEDNEDLHIGEEVHLTCVPYSKNTKRVIEFIGRDRDTCEGDTNILVAHLGISGATVGSSHYPMQDAFSLGDLRPDYFKYVALGHYHDKQFLGDRRNVFYTGSPIAHNFGEVGEKGFVVVDTSKRWDLEFVPLDTPRFYTVDKNIDTEFLEECAQHQDYVRINLKESQLEEFVARAPHNLNYRVELEKEYERETRVDIEVGMSFEEMVKKYSQEFRPEATEIGLAILKEAEND